MKTIDQRINNIIGQLEGIKKMRSCSTQDFISVLTQLKATRSALVSLMDKVIVEEFDCLLKDTKVIDRERLELIFNKIIKNK